MYFTLSGIITLDKAEQPDGDADVDVWLAEPISVVVREVLRYDVEQPTTLHYCVQGVESCAHQHNCYRHLRVAAQQ